MDKLSAERLRRVYDVATPRVRRYLQAEVEYVLQNIRPEDTVLDLGCGYGRTLPPLSAKAALVVGVDNAIGSLMLGKVELKDSPGCVLVGMDAVQLAFSSGIFDRVVCIQNGISAFHVERKSLIKEAVRVTRPGGTVLFSSYSDKFWDSRLKWFQLQADAGLLGEIDEERTGNGVIVCKDGFTATTVGQDEFLALTAELGLEARVDEVDESSLFCTIVVHDQP